MIAAAGRSADALRTVEDLEAIAAGLVERARATWPRVKIPDQAFATHVGEGFASVGEEEAFDPREALTDLHAADLWLALGCGRGDRVAIAELDKQLAPVVAAALARLRGKVVPDDVAQLLREKLLVARSGSAPKILDYSGRGPLGGWLRIAAVRTALSMTRHGDAAAMQPVTREALLGVPSTADPELEHLRKKYAREFKAAFEAALAELSAEDRNLLRLSLVDQLSIDEIGVIFSVHRATAARRVANARELVQEGTRKILRERLKLRAPELKSIMRYIQSYLDLSIQRLLTPEEATAAKGSRGKDEKDTKSVKASDTPSTAGAKAPPKRSAKKATTKKRSATKNA